jgi:hypothetical protein
MSTSTTLIQPAEVVNGGILKAAPVSDRFDSSLLAAHVKPAEIRFLRPLLCEDFYLDLIAEKNGIVSNYNDKICPIVEAYPNNATYETLWKEYLLPFLGYSVLWQSLPFIGVQVASTGILELQSDYSQNTGISGVKFMQDTLLTSIEVMTEELRRHLCENKDIYPLFKSDKFCKCECNNDDCNECKRSKVHASKLGIMFYDTPNYKTDKSKFKDLY